VRAWVPRHCGLAVETSGQVAARDGGVLLVPALPAATDATAVGLLAPALPAPH
jgi:hypothetical protein